MKADELEKVVIRLEEQLKADGRVVVARLDALAAKAEAIDGLVKQVAELVQENKDLRKQVADQKEDLRSLTNRLFQVGLAMTVLLAGVVLSLAGLKKP